MQIRSSESNICPYRTDSYDEIIFTPHAQTFKVSSSETDMAKRPSAVTAYARSGILTLKLDAGTADIDQDRLG